MATIFDDIIRNFAGGASRMDGPDERRRKRYAHGALIPPPTTGDNPQHVQPLDMFTLGQMDAQMQPQHVHPELTAPMPQPSPTDALTQNILGMRSQRSELAAQPVVNNDKGFWGRLADIGRQAVIGAGTAYQMGRGTPDQRLAEALGGGIAGGFQGGFDPSVDERRAREMQLAQMDQQIAETERQRELELQTRQKEAAIADIEARPELKAREIARKEEADRQKRAYNEQLLADKKRGRDLTETQINDLRTWRQHLMEQGAKVNEAKIRQIDERLKDYDLDRESRERIAFGNQAARVNETTRKAVQNAIDNAARNTKNRADAAKKIADIRRGAPKDATEDDIQNRINEYIYALPPEFRPEGY